MGIIFNSLPEEHQEHYLSLFDLELLRKKHKQKKKGFMLMYAKSHPAIFAYFMLGLKLRPYQVFAIDKILCNGRVGLCWARRLGKSTILALLAFWLTRFNLEPKNAIEKYTEIGLISRGDNEAKVLLSTVRELIYRGDAHMAKVYKQLGKAVHDADTYFTKHLIEPNNMEIITWDNRSRIRSLAPTNKVRGKGFSRLFIDELAFLEPKEDISALEYYSSVALPTVGDTNGGIVISSTPNGMGGVFFELFDPFGENDTDFIGLHFNWKVNSDSVNYEKFVRDSENVMRGRGDYRLFKQEFLAEFVTTQQGFFHPSDVNKYFVEDTLSSVYEYKKGDCSLGVDYGFSQSRTVLTVKTLKKDKIVTLFRRVLPGGFDMGMLTDPSFEDGFEDLNRRFKLKWIVTDDCPAGDVLNKWLEREGYPVYPYSFANVQDKNKAFYAYRGLVRQGKVVGFYDEDFKREMLEMREKTLTRNVSISKPNGGSDDMVDSEVFATVPFFEDTGGGSGVLGEVSFGSKDVSVVFSGIDERKDVLWESMKERESGSGGRRGPVW